MSKLEELIKELCPNGVQYVAVDSVCDTITDYTAAGSFADIAKNVKYNNNVDFAQLIRTTDLKSNFEVGKFIYVNEHAFNYLWRVNLDSESIILPNVGNCGEVYYVTPETLPYKNNVLGPNAILVRSSTANNKYLSYVFSSIEFQNQLTKITSTTGQTKFNKTNFKRLQIPLPDLLIQREIVHILDSFTLLKAELKAELKARRQQYEYYRDYLLNFEADFYSLAGDIDSIKNNINYIKLGEIATITRGTRVVRKQLQEYGTYPVYQNSLTPLGYYDNNNRSANTAYVIAAGAAGEIGYSYIDFWAADDCYTFDCPDNLNSRYLYYVLMSNQSKILSQVRKSSIPRLPRTVLDNLVIPVPSLEEQERVVSILDRFDKLCNDISEGLPAEIEARQKQYEYYRDKLLSFKEK